MSSNSSVCVCVCIEKKTHFFKSFLTCLSVGEQKNNNKNQQKPKKQNQKKNLFITKKTKINGEQSFLLNFYLKSIFNIILSVTLFHIFIFHLFIIVFTKPKYKHKHKYCLFGLPDFTFSAILSTSKLLVIHGYISCPYSSLFC